MSDLLTAEEIADRIVWNQEDAWLSSSGYSPGVLVDKGALEHLIVKAIKDQTETLQAKNDELQAQVRGLVEAFDGRDSGEVTMQMLNDAGINPFAVQLLCESFSRLERKIPIKFKFNDIVFILGANFDATLSTLPPEWLERERKREAVIQAAKEGLIAAQASIDAGSSIPEYKELRRTQRNLIEAIKALEDKK